MPIATWNIKPCSHEATVNFCWFFPLSSAFCEIYIFGEVITVCLRFLCSSAGDIRGISFISLRRLGGGKKLSGNSETSFFEQVVNMGIKLTWTDSWTPLGLIKPTFLATLNHIGESLFSHDIYFCFQWVCSSKNFALATDTLASLNIIYIFRVAIPISFSLKRNRGKFYIPKPQICISSECFSRGITAVSNFKCLRDDRYAIFNFICVLLN